MRNRKAILFLCLAVLALAAANLAVYFNPDGETSVKRPSLVPLRDDVNGIRLSRPGAADTVLEKGPLRWRLVAPYAGSVDEQVVLKLVDALAMTPVSEAITDAELLKLGRSRADFTLEDPILAVSLTTASGRTETVGFGKPTPTADGIYASVAGVDAVFIVPAQLLESVDVSAARFRRRSLFLVGADDIASFGIKSGTGPILEFVRDGNDWKMREGTALREGKASRQKVVGFLSALTSAEASSFVWPVGASNETDHASTALLAGYGLEPETAVTVTLKGVDGADRRISFGKEGAAGGVYALVQNGGAIVTVPSALKEAASQEAFRFTEFRHFPVEARAVDLFSCQVDGVLYALARGKEGEWNLESPITARADRQVAETLLSRILALSSADVPGPDGVAVSVSTNARPVTVSRASVFGDLTVESLRSKEVVSLDPALVRRIVRTRGEEEAKPVAVVYDRDRRLWNVENGGEDASVVEDGVRTVLSAVCPLTAVRVVKLKVKAADLDDYGLDSPFLTVAVDVGDGDDAVRRNVIVGKPTAGGRFATVGSSDAVFVISDESVRKLLSEIVRD